MLVIAAKSGQLGNRLLLFAHYIAFAIENNLWLLNPAFDEYAEFFQATAKDLFCAYPPPPLKIQANRWLRIKYYQFNRYIAESKLFKLIDITREKPFNWNDSKVTEQVKTNSLVFMQGWLLRDGWFVQDIPNLRKHREAIREYFKPLEKYRQNVNKLIATIRKDADILIGIHIRQGDYQQHQSGRYFYQSEDYVKVMASVKQLFSDKKVRFLICCNAKQDPNLLAEFDYYFGNNQIIEDMYSLAECDYIMGPPSSYTMWGSFYGDKPLYMLRDLNKAPNLNDFLRFDDWKGVFHYREDWSQSYWEWTH